MKQRPYPFFVILLLISLGYFATDIYLPSLPALAEAMGASDAMVQLTITSYLLTFSLTPLIFGPLSDHIGRKKVVLGGAATGAFATLGCCLSSQIETFIFFRFIQGVGLGAVAVAVRSIVSDLYSGQTLAKKLSLFVMAIPVILAIAPTFGGFLQESLGWRAVFLFLFIYCSAIGLSVTIFDESIKKKSDRPLSQVLHNYKEVVANAKFMLYCAGLAIPTVGTFAYLTSSSFLFQEVIGLSPFTYGSLSIIISSVIVSAAFFNRLLLNRLSIQTIIWVGSVLMIISGVLLFLFHFAGILTAASLFVPCALYFTCYPLCISNFSSLAINSVDRHLGSANGVVTSIQFLSGMLSSLAFSYLPENSSLPLALCFFVTGVLTVGNLLFIHFLPAQSHGLAKSE